jgi:protein SERAC1
VDEASAAPILDNVERSGLAASHSEMCKFEKASTGYKTVAAAIMRYSKEAPSIVSTRWVQAKEMLSTQHVNEASELTRPEAGGG